MAAQTTLTLNATLRETTGSAEARRVRKQGLVPAICYGHGIDNLNVAVDPKEFEKITEQPNELNTVFALDIEGSDTVEYVMLRDYQVHPVKRTLTHADFVSVDPEAPINVIVPLEAEGEAQGVKEGGRLHFIRRGVAVMAPPAQIPQALTVDVSHLGPDDAIMADDIDYPEGVEPAHDIDYAVIRVQMPREEIVVGTAPTTTAAVTPTTEEGEEGAEEEGAEEEGVDASAMPPGA